MALVLVALIAGLIAAACVVALHVSYRRWADRRPPPALEAVDQGPRGGHLGWFEGRWGRALHLDVLYAVVVTRDRLLLLRVGGQLSGRPSYYYSAPEQAAQAKRRARCSEELAAAVPPEALLGRHRRDVAIPLHEIERATVSPRRQFGWVGPAKLVLERAGAPATTLILEDEWQVAACALALRAVLGEAVRIDPLLAPMLTDTPTAARESMAQRTPSVQRALAILFGVIAALLLSLVSISAGPARLDATTGRLVSCKPVRRDRSSPVLMMKLDASPLDLRFELHGEDVADLREACRSHAHVNVVYRQVRAGGPAWVRAISYVGGPEIVSGEGVARRRRSNAVGGAAVGGVFAGIALGMFTIAALARRRRERPRSAAPPR